MKNLFKNILLLFILFFISCNENYIKIDQEIIDGKVSATEESIRGRMSRLPVIYVQSPTKTVRVSIPYNYENKWKVGDSCLLIIEKYKVKEY